MLDELMPIYLSHGLSVIEQDIAKLRYTQTESTLLDKCKTSWKDELREEIKNCNCTKMIVDCYFKSRYV